jgi:hypothetical protein
MTTRRSCRRLALIALALVLAVASVWAGVAHASERGARESGVPAGEGVGMYSDASTADHASTFTIDRRLVSCGVGAENIEGIGPFEMLMYSTKIKKYIVDRDAKEITARGEMRSITRAAGAVVEDVRHAFIAHALDRDGDEGQPRSDRFDIHFKTAFWQPGNLLCTPSDRYPGLCRFGGVLFAGDIHVASANGDDEDDDDGDSDDHDD